MKISASTPLPLVTSPVVNAQAAQATEPEAPQPADGFKKSGPMHTLGRVVTYSTAAALPGIGIVSNFMAASSGVSNVLNQQRGAEKNQPKVDAISMGAGVLAAVPNVLGLVTHQAGWFLASMVIGGIAGAATAYQAKH
jgi:hypothetical protein